MMTVIERVLADMRTEIAKLPEDFPNYGAWPVELPAGHWRALLAASSGET